MRIPAYAVALTLALTQAAFAGPYLSDLLKEDSFRQSWNALFADPSAVPDWVATFAKTSNGVVTPSDDITIDGKPYVYATLCKPHDCGANQLGIVFTATGDAAWAMLTEKDSGAPVTRLFGSPDPAVVAALQAQAGQ